MFSLVMPLKVPNNIALSMTSTELLSKISEIRIKHDLIAEFTGENFNVFSILGMEVAENRTHSAILRELLDPKGKHGMGDAFLNGFIRVLRKKFQGNEHFKKRAPVEARPLAAKVFTEIFLGNKSEDLTQGGRVDLAVTPEFGSWRILIENKINAGDQECQLIRYSNSDSSALLLYLTLEGVEASDFSTKDRTREKILLPNEDYFLLSYRNEIIEWLGICVKEASSRPLVRETINQYMHLIRKLTHQNSSSLMSKEISKAVLSSKEAVLAYCAMQNSDSAVKERILEVLKNRLEEVAKEFDLEFEMNLDRWGNKQKGFWFWKPEWREHGTSLGFMCEISMWRNWFFGFEKSRALNPQDSKLIDTINIEFNKHFNSEDPPNDWWAGSVYWRDYLNWDDADTLAAVLFGNFTEDLKGLLQKLLLIARVSGLPGDYNVRK